MASPVFASSRSPCHLAARILKGTGVFVGTTIGFPHGAHATSVKVFEARQAVADGATELDMVINIGQAIGGEWDAVAVGYRRRDQSRLTTRAAIVKVIFENCYLNDEQKVRLCQICGEVGADYVKTSTGYGTGGATVEDLRLMRRAAPPPCQAQGRRWSSHAGFDDRGRPRSVVTGLARPEPPRSSTNSRPGSALVIGHE